MSIPDSYLGVWKRTLLRTADGREDRSSHVFWLQTASLHADIRVPQHPLRTAQDRCSLAGFAGVTEVEGTLCRWRRLIDFHPDSPVDQGRMTFVSPDELHERALDDSYLEIWQRLPGSQGVCQALWLVDADNPHRAGCLLRAGDYFLFAADRPQPLTGTRSIEQRLVGLDAAQTERALAFELSFGRIDPSGHCWRVELSSLPQRTGRPLLLSPGLALPLDQWSAERIARLGAHPSAAGWRREPIPQRTSTREEAMA